VKSAFVIVLFFVLISAIYSRDSFLRKDSTDDQVVETLEIKEHQFDAAYWEETLYLEKKAFVGDQLNVIQKDVAIHLGCREYEHAQCIRHALSMTQEKLSSLRLKRSESENNVFRIMVFGNSLIASDHIIDVFREQMQSQYGDAGKGFVLFDRMAEYGRRNRTAQSAVNWQSYNIAMGEKSQYPQGITGVLHVATRAARSKFIIDSHQRIVIFKHASEKSSFKLIDANNSIEISTQEIHELKLQGDSTSIEFAATQGTVVYGVSFEKEETGVIVDTFGVPAADILTLQERDQALIEKQLSFLSPDLLIYVFGGNEIKRLAWKKRSETELREAIRFEIRERLQQDNSRDCLFIGPVENIVPSEQPPFRTRKELYRVNNLFAEESIAQGCAYWDLFAAMGGEGAIEKLSEKSMMHDDRVHPKYQALDLIGYELYRQFENILRIQTVKTKQTDSLEIRKHLNPQRSVYAPTEATVYISGKKLYPNETLSAYMKQYVLWSPDFQYDVIILTQKQSTTTDFGKKNCAQLHLHHQRAEHIDASCTQYVFFDDVEEEELFQMGWIDDDDITEKAFWPMLKAVFLQEVH
jgi:hypothetical protein